ncbi:MAG: sulfotransferase [Cyanothece sp. SIO1E1]|nr:sulfotransferase [Cyanothece sp. SIO1E1]
MIPNYKKLFIVGCPRSGTTWLARMLSLHPDVIAADSESHAYPLIYDPFTYLPKWNLQRRFQSKKWLLRNYGLMPLLIGIQPKHIWHGILRSYKIYQKVNEVGLHFFVTYAELQQLVHAVGSKDANDLVKAEYLIAHIFDHFFQRVGGLKGQTLVEKTPMHIRHVNVILNHFPEAKVIEMIRDGRDVCVSHAALAKGKRWASRKNAIDVMCQWKRCIELGEKFRADASIADRIHSVRYEQLRAHPQDELGQIFEFAGLNWSEALRNQIVAETDISKIKNKGEGLHIRKGTIGDWRTCLSETELTLFKQITGETLEKIGYSW